MTFVCDMMHFFDFNDGGFDGVTKVEGGGGEECHGEDYGDVEEFGAVGIVVGFFVLVGVEIGRGGWGGNVRCVAPIACVVGGGIGAVISRIISTAAAAVRVDTAGTATQIMIIGIRKLTHIRSSAGNIGIVMIWLGMRPSIRSSRSSGIVVRRSAVRSGRTAMTLIRSATSATGGTVETADATTQFFSGNTAAAKTSTVLTTIRIGIVKHGATDGRGDGGGALRRRRWWSIARRLRVPLGRGRVLIGWFRGTLGALTELHGGFCLGWMRCDEIRDSILD